MEFTNDIGTIWENRGGIWLMTVDVNGKSVNGFLDNLEEGKLHIYPSPDWLHTSTEYDEFFRQSLRLWTAYKAEVK